VYKRQVFYLLSKTAANCSGNTFTDEEVLANEGITDLDKYSVIPGAQLYRDLFVD
jgi:citronellol/citronellal dehydrogenase